MIVLVRSVPWHEERFGWAQELADTLGAELVLDSERDSYQTMLSALERQGDEGAWHLEDDVLPTSRWLDKARWLVSLRGSAVIQAYSDRTKDVTIGARWEPGGTLTGNQCFYVPGTIAPAMREALEQWDPYLDDPVKSMGQYDYAMADFMRRDGLRYWRATPSHVQHRHAPSLLQHHRAGRTSRTFVN